MNGEEFTKFIVEHAGDDTSKLLFAAGRYPGVDLHKAAVVIEARRKAAVKLPLWFSHPQIEYPSSLSLEQCSSQATALYKQRFVPENSTLADITGGLGVDCFFMSRKARKAYYFERKRELCEAARLNYSILGADNIEVCESDHISSGRTYDLIYADPSRRGKSSQRIYSIEDCEPDILSLKDRLLTLADTVLVKISPMADISRTLAQIPEIREIHVLSVENECKEILLVLRREESATQPGSIPLVCADIASNGTVSEFRFSLNEERCATPEYASSVGSFLFVPGKHILKAGAFKSVAVRYGLKKLSVSSHLYTGDAVCGAFPGKTFRVVEAFDWNKNAIEKLREQYAALEMTGVNFPLDTASLRKRLAIPAGGNFHLYATTLGLRKVCIITS